MKQLTITTRWILSSEYPQYGLSYGYHYHASSVVPLLSSTDITETPAEEIPPTPNLVVIVGIVNDDYVIPPLGILPDGAGVITSVEDV